jgi:hypothetical protein
MEFRRRLGRATVIVAVAFYVVRLNLIVIEKLAVEGRLTSSSACGTNGAVVT